ISAWGMSSQTMKPASGGLEPVRLGHADVRTTLALYTRATDSSDQAAARALDAHFLRRQPRGSDPSAPQIG
ncbi:MAG: hypothetical protein KY439_01190, partial [Actinobacteria bacterium]|nr:hypothetical protein [Actinomycetota bacterium]